MLNPLLYSTNLSAEEYKKYARHLIVNEIGINGQKRLKNASLLFIGAGGLASSAILYLAASGIGHIGIVDHDIVSISNLHRQILYNTDNIGELKVKAAEYKIKQINSECKVVTYPYQLNSNNSINLIQNYDLIIDTCDNFETRYIVDFVCYKLHKVHIYGAIQNFEGQISVFNYKGGPRYSNLYPNHLNLENQNCNNLGVLGILPGLIGLLQGIEAIKIILGNGKVLSGHIMRYNALNMSFKKTKINPLNQHTCTNTVNESIINNINIIAFRQLKNFFIEDNTIIIDVRQNIEFVQSHIKNAINIPLNCMKNKRTIEFIKNAHLDKITIIYCSSNSRAITASNILYKNKIKHYILKNGFNQHLDNLKYKPNICNIQY
uniref:Probable molybdopterin-synthase adenylyltransferase n=1 Tax=Grateloupia asiatica TaxID=151735 RepID=A0A6F8UM13_9FLOR|nr:putative molybdopterin-synthase adenylyltransferase [Grateloupia asiatica]